jgi:hypothetical protein
VCHSLLRDSRFFRFLLQIDRDLAREARQAGCPCGAALHSARYRRKPRGVPAGLGDDYALRESFCCSRDDCRSRLTPPSARFLGRKVYLSVVVALVTAMRQGPTPPGTKTLEEHLGVSRRTLGRWRTWWLEIFPRTAFWKSSKARFSPPLREDELPRSLLLRFGGELVPEAILKALRFLAGMTAKPPWPVHAF